MGLSSTKMHTMYLWARRMAEVGIAFELVRCGFIQSLYELRAQFSPFELDREVSFTCRGANIVSNISPAIVCWVYRVVQSSLKIDGGSIIGRRCN